MYNPDNIQEKYFTQYNRIIDLMNKKGPTPDKYNELKEILLFCNNEFNNMNSDELKLFKNLLMGANFIINKANPTQREYKEKKEECIKIYSLLKEKKTYNSKFFCGIKE